MSEARSSRAAPGSLATSLLFAVALGVAWEAAVRVFHVKSYLLPSLSAIGAAFWRSRSVLLDNGLITLGEVAVGFGASVILGALAAIAIYFVPVARATLYPFLVALQSVPKIGLAPLMVVWLGYGLGSKALMAFLFAFFPIVIASIGGFAGVPGHLIEHFRALGASPWTTFRKLQAPAVLPSFIDGCKVALPLAVIGAIVGEFVGSNNGLGNLILLATGASRMDLTFAALLTITGLSLGLFYIVECLGRLVWWRST